MNKLDYMRGKKKHRIASNFEVINPKLGIIADIGENEYQIYLHDIIATSVDIADILWVELQIWYEDITDEWAFFIEKSLTNEEVKVEYYECVEGEDYLFSTNTLKMNEQVKEAFNFFLDKKKDYVLFVSETNDEEDLYYQSVEKNNDDVYCVSDSDFKITKHTHTLMCTYLKELNFINSKNMVTQGGNRRAKEYIMKNQYSQRKKKRTDVVNLESIVSSLIAKGCSYEEIWDYPIYLIYDLYNRYIKFDEWDRTMSALSSGNIDTKKNPVDYESINWSSVIKN